MAKATQPAASAAPVWTVIKSAKAPKISARASGLLHYEVGKNDDGRYALRITAKSYCQIWCMGSGGIPV